MSAFFSRISQGALCVALFSVLSVSSAAASEQSAPPPAAVLKRVVLVARHGIRSPTQKIETLNVKTGRSWSPWPVPPGQLTDHGRADLQLMGDFIRHYYAPFSGLGGAEKQVCPHTSSLFVWADAADTRTRQTGDILAQSMSGGCVSQAHSLAPGQKDPLFNALASGHAYADQHNISAILQAVYRHDEAGALPQDVREAEETLQKLFDPEGCGHTPAICFTAPARLTWKKGAPHASGGLALSATVSENLLLEYAQGLPATVSLPASSSDDSQIALLNIVLPAHNYQSETIRRMPPLAARRGQFLVSAILALLDNKVPPSPAEAVFPQDAKVVVFAGHDTTLDMLSALFGLDWSFKDQPDPTAPDTVLGFELWQMPDGKNQVKFVIFHQSLKQLRETLPVADRADHGQPQVLQSRLCQAETVCTPEVLARHIAHAG